MDSIISSLKNNSLKERGEFHIFNRLPKELRQKIWSLTTPPPFFVSSGLGNCFRYEEEDVISNFISVIHSCREARDTLFFDEESSAKPDHQDKYSFKNLSVNASNKVLYSQGRDVVVLSCMALRFIDQHIQPTGQYIKLYDTFSSIKYLMMVLSSFDRHFGREEDFEMGDDSSSDEEEEFVNRGGDRSFRASMDVFPKYFPAVEKIIFMTDNLSQTEEPGVVTDDAIGPLNTAPDTEPQLRYKKMATVVENLFADASLNHPDWRVPALCFREEDDCLNGPIG